MFILQLTTARFSLIQYRVLVLVVNVVTVVNVVNVVCSCIETLLELHFGSFDIF